jgi:hypothetical protein
LNSKKEVYLETQSGSQILVEIEDHHGWVNISADNFEIKLSPDSAFDLVDALTIVANDIDSFVEERW